MARIVKAKDYMAKRNEILAVAQRLIYTKGYEQMTIQDILNELQMSKGAFYHYFDSKQELLEALIEHMLEEVERIITSITNDPELSAPTKLQRIMVTLNRWKFAQKTFQFALLRVWYNDDNAIVRLKMRAMMLKQITPLLTPVIHQGIDEGSLTTSYPDEAGEVMLSLLQDLSDTLAALLLAPEPDLPRIERAVSAYLDALERVLGCSSGTLHLIDAQMLQEWITSS
ncbi:TetR family transcriptional regulator [Reticulibacter mediterranei]|uniref:TetR family transcriptional regulator n=1 Tax=Reticulibacter mediterranei TaxID=2778369 RepID=A0A8J3N0J4_9CHLR|nr:TetR/AcrR family transcriptional regulator [Reticulibacter mediterranei]GHO94284.1 TetR family transcriptional regulator [Reticulibacter mediterranei]